MRAAVLSLAALLGGIAPMAVARAATPPRACAPRFEGEPRRGPCSIVDTLGALLPPRGAATPSAATPLLVTNFGVVVPTQTPGQYAYVCEDLLGTTATDFITMDASGGVVAPGTGLHLATADGAGRCGFRDAPAPLAGRPVLTVAPDPNDARRSWALVGQQARELYRSDDGGASYAQIATWPTSLRLWKLAVAPSDSRVVYVAGYALRDEADPVARPAAGLTLVVTHDGGATFETLSPAAGFADSRWIVFLGASPEDPQTVFMVRAAAPDGGDELWRSTDGGRTASKVLELPVGHTHAGFAFGDVPGLVYTAGRPALQTEADNSAELYVSHDGGVAWQPAVRSGADGPRYRCLAARGGHLFACAGGDDAGDRFLLGRSDDDGRTWQPVITTAQITGPVACGVAACTSTASWLCQYYDVCGTAGAPTDGGTDAKTSDAGAPAETNGGCSCDVGGERSASFTLARALSMFVMAMLVRRHLRGRPR